MTGRSVWPQLRSLRHLPAMPKPPLPAAAACPTGLRDRSEAAIAEDLARVTGAPGYHDRMNAARSIDAATRAILACPDHDAGRDICVACWFHADLRARLTDAILASDDRTPTADRPERLGPL